MTGAVQPLYSLCFQCRAQHGGINAVILNRIGNAHHFGMLKTGQGMQHGELHIGGHGGGEALQIHFLGVFSDGLHKELMPLLIRKANDLILNGGAIARTDALYFSAVQRGAMKILADDAVRLLIGINDMAGQLRQRGIGIRIGAHGKRRHIRISHLKLKP